MITKLIELQNFLNPNIVNTLPVVENSDTVVKGVVVAIGVTINKKEKHVK